MGPVSGVEVIASGHGVKQLALLRRLYGAGSWRKLKGIALVKLRDGTIVRAELHWFEAHGIGRRRMKVKKVVE